MLQAKHLGVKYSIPIRNIDRITHFIEELVGREIGTMPRVDALKDFSIEIRAGEKVGVIGRNGAGKSTFLKAVCGKIGPTSGTIHVDGKTHYLEAGNISVDTEISVEQNLINNLEIKGVPKSNWREIVSSVRNFVELGDYFERPMKVLSLGMSARSVFAIVTELIDGDLIVVDEYLTAGDLYWQERCAARFSNTLSSKNNTLLLVSHALDQVRLFCDRCIWIEGGQLVMDGQTAEVINEYEAYLEKIRWRGDEDEKLDNSSEALFTDEPLSYNGESIPVKRFPGLGHLRIKWVKVNNEFGSNHKIDSLKTISVGLYQANAVTKPVRVIVTLWSETGKRLAVLENEALEFSGAGGEFIEVSFDIRSGFEITGKYSISVAVYQLNNEQSASESGSNRLDVISKAIKVECHGAHLPGCLIISEDSYSIAVESRDVSRN